MKGGPGTGREEDVGDETLERGGGVGDGVGGAVGG